MVSSKVQTFLDRTHAEIAWVDPGKAGSKEKTSSGSGSEGKVGSDERVQPLTKTQKRDERGRRRERAEGREREKEGTREREREREGETWRQRERQAEGGTERESEGERRGRNADLPDDTRLRSALGLKLPQLASKDPQHIRGLSPKYH